MVVGKEEQTVKSLLQEFVRESIPEYIIDGSHAIVAQGGVQKLTVKKRDGYWDVDGQIQGEDFQVYASELSVNLRDRTTNFFCNCPDSFSGVCRHVGATALKLIKNLDDTKDEDAAQSVQKTEWRQTFRAFFSTEPEPEAGRHY